MSARPKMTAGGKLEEENTMTREQLLKNLESPKGEIDVVLDTDTFNETDDQYALAYLVRYGDRLRLKGLYAAPFTVEGKAKDAAEGMEKSYNEILHILSLMGREDLYPIVYRGSDRYLPDENTPVDSDAARRLAALAMEYTPERPLYVVAIGAITNVASALLLNPDIRDRIVIVWLGGHAYHWEDTKEFNMYQDVAAARIVFGCGAPLVQLPCMGVVSHFVTTGPELEAHMRGKNSLCDYLLDLTTSEALFYGGNDCWSRIVWDVTAVAWLLGGDYLRDRVVDSPVVEYDGTYSCPTGRHPIKYVHYVDRDKLFSDLFAKLGGQ